MKLRLGVREISAAGGAGSDVIVVVSALLALCPMYNISCKVILPYSYSSVRLGYPYIY